MNERESIIICEGFYDRAFWHGLLVHQFACKDKRMSGPWGDPKGGGIYGLYSPSKFPLRIQPISQQPERQTGEKKENPVFREARRLLTGRETKPLKHLIINVDPDTEEVSQRAKQIHAEQLLRFMQGIIPDAHTETNGDVLLDEDATRVSLVAWRVDSDAHSSVPIKQTLERLVSAAISSAYPHRAENVKDWLASRIDPPQHSPKEVAWSYMAGWFAESGCERFLKDVWNDPSVVAGFKRILEENGSWEKIIQFAE